MRQIQKSNECEALRTWRRDNAAVPQNLVYGKGGFPRAKDGLQNLRMQP